MPVRRQLPTARAACLMATTSACAVGSRSASRRLRARAMTAPSASRMTAPTGTSCGTSPPRAGGSRIAGSKLAVYPVTASPVTGSRAEGVIQGALHRFAESQPLGHAGHGVLGVEVEVGRYRAEFHLLQAEVGEDRHVARGQHLIELVVRRDRDVAGLERLPGQRGA